MSERQPVPGTGNFPGAANGRSGMFRTRVRGQPRDQQGKTCVGTGMAYLTSIAPRAGSAARRLPSRRVQVSSGRDRNTQGFANKLAYAPEHGALMLKRVLPEE